MVKVSREELEEQVKNSRSMSPDGSKVVYDLTTGVDFSDPRLLGDILAEEFFKQDVSGWFQKNGNSLDFHPKYRAEILVSDDRNREISKTMNDFYSDLRKNDISGNFSDVIENSATYHSGIGTYMFAGIMGALIIQHSMRSAQMKDYVQKLMQQVMGNTDVRTMNMTS